MALTVDAAALRQILAEDAEHRRALAVDPQTPTPHHVVKSPKDLPKMVWDASLPTITRDRPRGAKKLVSAAAAQEIIRDMYPLVWEALVQANSSGQLLLAGGFVGLVAQDIKTVKTDIDVFCTRGATPPDEILDKFLGSLLGRLRRRYLQDYAEWCVQKLESKTFAKTLAETEFQQQEALRTFEAFVTEWVEDADVSKAGVTCVDLSQHVANFSEINSRTVLTNFKAEAKRRDRRRGENAAVTMVRNKNAVSFTVDDTEVQFILRLYERPEHVVYGFDLGSSSIALTITENPDDAQYIISPLGAFAYATSHNVVDMERLSPSYTFRLEKYFSDRKFDIILPEFNIQAISRENISRFHNQVIEMGAFWFTISSLKSKRLYTSHLFTKRTAGTETSDYGSLFRTERTALGYNIRVLRKGGDNFIHRQVYYLDDADTAGINAAPVVFDCADLVNKIGKLASNIWNPERGTLNLRAMEGIEANFDLTEFRNLSAYAKQERIQEAAAAYTEKLTALWEEKINSVPPAPVVWMTENTASQTPSHLFTGSFQPEATSAKEWYGKYHKKALTVKTVNISALHISDDEDMPELEDTAELENAAEPEVEDTTEPEVEDAADEDSPATEVEDTDEDSPATEDVDSSATEDFVEVPEAQPAL